MVKWAPGSDWEPWPALHRKSYHIVVKFLILVILVGVTFRLLFFRSPEFEAVPKPRESSASALSLENSEPREDSSSTNSSASVPGAAASVGEQVSKQGNCIMSSADKCDLFTGQWIRNPLGPAYTNKSCRFIEPPQNCMKNGRPDTGYLFWKWKPNGCDISPFDARKFFDIMKNRRWALIGDSILRNHAQSLICLLSKVEEPIEVYHGEQFKSRRWHFPAHNFNLSLIWSPFLIKAEIFENDEGEAKSENRLHIDTLDVKWTSQYNDFDYVIISGGQWFLKSAIYVENGTIVGCHYCPQLKLPEISLEYSYARMLNSVYRFIATSEHKPVVIYRTWTPDHFEHGEWFSGGHCNRTAPYKLGEFGGTDADHLMRKMEIDEFNKAVAIEGSENGSHLRLLDTYPLSILRPDAHSGAYRKFHPFEQGLGAKVQYDCLHWCLPGAIDSWNDILMKLVVDE